MSAKSSVLGEHLITLFNRTIEVKRVCKTMAICYVILNIFSRIISIGTHIAANMGTHSLYKKAAWKLDYG